MTRIVAESTRRVAAPAEVVYGLIADYREGHPRILPEQYFGRLDVEAGGIGAGTRIRFETRLFGKTVTHVGEISEPAPGRELRETLADGTVTSYLIEPVGAAECRVTIRTEYQRAGVRGWVERWLVPGALREVYEAELVKLARVAKEMAPAGAAH